MGHWEYKWTLNNSWDQNYGLYGEPNGPGITLDLCYPAKVAFNFSSYNCSGYGYANVITNGVCVDKFYDANVNGYPDPGEEPMGGVAFTLTGNGITRTQKTDNDGKAAFTNLPDGVYVIREKVPSGYYASIADSQTVYLFGRGATANFGNVCIGAGGAKGMGFWASKNGEAALNNSGKLEDALWWLRYWGLRNADGTDFDPYTYSQLKTWLLGASAKNMNYMLSAQLAAMYLNIELGYVSYDRYIYTPGCFWWGNFMNVYNLIWYTNSYLSYKTTVDGKDPERGYVDCLKTAFDNANKDLTFVQLHPCGAAITKSEKNTVPEGSALSAAKIWPNPSNNYFTLRPASVDNKETVQLKVYNINGQEVYTGKGLSNKEYRFGERFAPGVYMVELIQGNNRSTFKLVKQ
ncbi:MAG: T9SS type A sorting domain-containing protein [Bacteroidetes bacterium]|nr:MAG: T9SS type A sorting domain-containing protein [Bacteroidota bacterium]